MARITGIGLQDFEKIKRENIFLVDKTEFIREWWENKDDVTLITRPRRFGKTLTMSMVEQFFSVQYKGTDVFSDRTESIIPGPLSISLIKGVQDPTGPIPAAIH